MFTSCCSNPRANPQSHFKMERAQELRSRKEVEKSSRWVSRQTSDSRSKLSLAKIQQMRIHNTFGVVCWIYFKAHGLLFAALPE